MPTRPNVLAIELPAKGVAPAMGEPYQVAFHSLLIRRAGNTTVFANINAHHD